MLRRVKVECQALDCEEGRWESPHLGPKAPYCRRHLTLYLWWEMEEIETVTIKTWFMVL